MALYWILIIAIMIVSLVVQQSLKRKFNKYSKVGLQIGLSGKEVAELMLRDNNIHDVSVVSVQGKLTDHYNPVDKTVNLSPEVYSGRSVMAAAVAAHECGHAIQHATAYRPLEMRSALVPLQNASGRVINFLFFALIFGSFMLPNFITFDAALPIIIGAYTIFTLFAFITLPVEYDATKRALAWVEERNITTGQEHGMAEDALNAAARTYVVAALSSLAMLLYYVSLFLGRD
ncbi:zinc metallopeptidase [Roseivirga sp. UBA838]|uniref:zinc metallopeptidase n=1 Tax=Roseivirga sp. UBA838 TaxID=1947393 RepID=UPI002579E9F5|nr:zinc metallopeptidase [Roseivirga sp. UBA838]|tara:strand:+ start:77645 stop:78340 length:696 start_codon:yes stop_codon:yes gene_type:complete